MDKAELMQKIVDLVQIIINTKVSFARQGHLLDNIQIDLGHLHDAITSNSHYENIVQKLKENEEILQRLKLIVSVYTKTSTCPPEIKSCLDEITQLTNSLIKRKVDLKDRSAYLRQPRKSLSNGEAGPPILPMLKHKSSIYQRAITDPRYNRRQHPILNLIVTDSPRDQETYYSLLNTEFSLDKNTEDQNPCRKVTNFFKKLIPQLG